MTDEELIQACRKNDRRAQNELYKKYFPLMSSIAMRYCSSGEEMLQLVNMAYLKILQNLDKYDNKKNLSTWMRKVQVNHIIDEYRKKKKHISSVHLQYDEKLDQHAGQVNLVESKWEENALRDMLNRLPDMSATVFNLFAIDGYSHKEIAEKLSISTGTSKWHVSEARKRLKNMLEEARTKEKKRRMMNYE